MIPILTTVPTTSKPQVGGQDAFFEAAPQRLVLDVKTDAGAANTVLLYRLSATYDDWVASADGAVTTAAAARTQETRWDPAGISARYCLVGTQPGTYAVVAGR